MPKPGPVCPNCDGGASTLRDAGDVYGPKFAGKFSMWVCANYPDCNSYVGIIDSSPIAEPAGTLADVATRGLRRRLRAAIEGDKLPKKTLREHLRRVNYMGEDECRKALMARGLAVDDYQEREI